jgi:FAD/FMN-containing dehydrogenase
MKSVSDRLPDFFNKLRNHITGELRTDAYSRILYSTDASNYQVMPYGVLVPKTVEDIQAALELAARYRVPILPRASGTSLAGQAVNEALVIDVTRYLDRVLEVNADECWACNSAPTRPAAIGPLWAASSGPMPAAAIRFCTA